MDSRTRLSRESGLGRGKSTRWSLARPRNEQEAGVLGLWATGPWGHGGQKASERTAACSKEERTPLSLSSSPHTPASSVQGISLHTWRFWEGTVSSSPNFYKKINYGPFPQVYFHS